MKGILLLVVAACVAKELHVQPRGNGLSCTASAPCSLATAIELAIDGDAVLLQRGLYLNESFPLAVNKSVTFAGEDALATMLNGSSKTGLLSLINASVALENLTFAHGFAPAGGAVYASNCTLQITRCRFVNNTAVATAKNSGGGAVFLNNTAAVVSDSWFHNSTATGVGGAIGALFAANLTWQNTWYVLSIATSQFIENKLASTVGAQGAAIGVVFDVVQSNNTQLVFAGSTFASNIAHGGTGDSQGAVAVVHLMNSVNSSVTSYKNTFAKNNATVTAGSCYGGGLSVVYTKLSTNDTVSSVADFYLGNICLAGQQGNAEGGALSVMLNQDSVNSAVILQQCVIQGNEVRGHYSAVGGGVSVMNNGDSTKFTLVDSYNTYQNNTAISGGEGSSLGGGLSVFFNA
jgi:hypothetical protein